MHVVLTMKTVPVGLDWGGHAVSILSRNTLGKTFGLSSVVGEVDVQAICDLLCLSCESGWLAAATAVAAGAAAGAEAGGSEEPDDDAALSGVPAARTHAPPADCALGSKASLRFLPGTCCQSLLRAGKIS